MTSEETYNMISVVIEQTIQKCAEIAQERIDMMRQKVETEKWKETPTFVDYYQGRVNEGEVIKAHILRQLQPKNNAESLFLGALSGLSS